MEKRIAASKAISPANPVTRRFKSQFAQIRHRSYHARGNQLD